MRVLRMVSVYAKCVFACMLTAWLLQATRRWWGTARAADGQTFGNKARRVRRRGARALRRWVGNGRSKAIRLARKLWGKEEEKKDTNV